MASNGAAGSPTSTAEEGLEVLLKLTFKKDMRRVRVRLPLAYDALCGLLGSTFGAIDPERGAYACSYVDDEDDTINVCNDLDLEEAFRVCGATTAGGSGSSESAPQRGTSMRFNISLRSTRHRDSARSSSNSRRAPRHRSRGRRSRRRRDAPAPEASSSSQSHSHSHPRGRARSDDGLAGGRHAAARRSGLGMPVDLDSLSSVFSSASILGSVDGRSVGSSNSGTNTLDQPWHVAHEVTADALTADDLDEWGIPESLSGGVGVGITRDCSGSRRRELRPAGAGWLGADFDAGHLDEQFVQLSVRSGGGGDPFASTGTPERGRAYSNASSESTGGVSYSEGSTVAQEFAAPELPPPGLELLGTGSGELGGAPWPSSAAASASASASESASASALKPSVRLRCRVVRDAAAQPLVARPRETFTKTWRIRNNDTKVSWPPGCLLTRIGGEELGTAERVQASGLGPGETVEIQMRGHAPVKCGRYTSYWRMVHPDGTTRFGQRMWIDLHVVAQS